MLAERPPIPFAIMEGFSPSIASPGFPFFPEKAVLCAGIYSPCGLPLERQVRATTRLGHFGAFLFS